MSPPRDILHFSCTHSVGFNDITGDAADNLATAVLDHAAMIDFCGIPLVSLRENSITKLNLNSKGVGVPGALVLSKLLPSATALLSLKCACQPNDFCSAPP